MWLRLFLFYYYLCVVVVVGVIVIFQLMLRMNEFKFDFFMHVILFRSSSERWPNQICYSCHTLSKHIVISNPTSFNQAWTNENESSNIQLRSICNFESRKGKCTHLFNIMSHTITFICERRRYRISWKHTRHVHTTQSTFNSIIQQYFINEIDKICFSFQLNERNGG